MHVLCQRFLEQLLLDPYLPNEFWGNGLPALSKGDIESNAFSSSSLGLVSRVGIAARE